MTLTYMQQAQGESDPIAAELAYLRKERNRLQGRLDRIAAHCQNYSSDMDYQHGLLSLSEEVLVEIHHVAKGDQ